MPDIRLVALDLDGTVFNDEKEITPRTLEAIRAAIAKGVDVIPATGRVGIGCAGSVFAHSRRAVCPDFQRGQRGGAFHRANRWSTCRLMLPLPATFMISWPQWRCHGHFYRRQSLHRLFWCQ